MKDNIVHALPENRRVDPIRKVEEGRREQCAMRNDVNFATQFSHKQTPAAVGRFDERIGELQVRREGSQTVGWRGLGNRYQYQTASQCRQNDSKTLNQFSLPGLRQRP